ncbi:MAG: hypothetical protein ACYDBT_12610 [Desulfobulbaceae bacterium]
MKQSFILLLASMLTLVLACFPAAAGTLAVFPLLDLSQDESGVNLSLTGYLREKAAEQGFTVLPEEEVMAFMVRHRIRSLGVLTTYQLTTLRRELNTEYVLLGTVCQLDQKPAAKLSLSLQLIRTADETVVWSVIRDLHEADLISLLAISDPESLNELYERYFNTLFADMPPEMREGGSEAVPMVGILNVNFHAGHVKPGEKMEAAIRVYYSEAVTKPPAFHLRIDATEYPVDQDGDARLLNTSWLAQEQNGTYPVDLVAVFPSGLRQVERIGEYTVDGIPPELTVNFFGTATEDDAVFFNRELFIIPLLEVPEALDRWEIAVYNKDRELVLLQDGTGQIPPQIIWNGMLSGVESAPDGRYMVLIQVWDRAGNLGRFEGFVNLMRTDPKLILTVEREGSVVHVLLDNEVQSPLAFWFAKVYEKSGEMLASRVGETLPVTLDITLPDPESNDPLELIFAAQDRYGNRTWRKVENLLNLGATETEVEIVPESQWLENF